MRRLTVPFTLMDFDVLVTVAVGHDALDVEKIEPDGDDLELDFVAMRHALEDDDGEMARLEKKAREQLADMDEVAAYDAAEARSGR